MLRTLLFCLTHASEKNSLNRNIYRKQFCIAYLSNYGKFVITTFSTNSGLLEYYSYIRIWHSLTSTKINFLLFRLRYTGFLCRSFSICEKTWPGSVPEIEFYDVMRLKLMQVNLTDSSNRIIKILEKRWRIQGNLKITSRQKEPRVNRAYNSFLSIDLLSL